MFEIQNPKHGYDLEERTFSRRIGMYWFLPQNAQKLQLREYAPISGFFSHGKMCRIKTDKNYA